MDFPASISLTITNVCNLRCRMCGQWSEEGYMHDRKKGLKQEMTLDDWKRVVDELAAHSVPALLIRGGEPFLHPQIIKLLEYIHSQGMFISIDTNGTLLAQYAADVARIGKIHLTVSVDGPEEIHDQVRGVSGCFARLKEGLAQLNELDPDGRISRSITFTISKYSYRGLGAMPDVARSLGIGAVCIVPYYYVPQEVGERYAQELREHLGCEAFSWSGFHHEDSGVDFDEFKAQLARYQDTLGDVYSFPYMPMTEDEYRIWFQDAVTPVGPLACTNVEKLIDIQPQGNANFCVDFPDYTIGNVKESTIAEIWNGERAARFREYRRQQPLAVCTRCGAKYMSEIDV